MRTISIVLLAAALLGAVASDADEPGKPPADTAKPPPSQCYFVRDIESWKPAADAKSIFVRIDLHHFVKLELASSCPTLTWPDARLITKWHSSSFCDALDWQLSVSQGPPGHFEVPCIVKKVVPMSPEEVAALPPKQRP